MILVIINELFVLINNLNVTILFKFKLFMMFLVKNKTKKICVHIMIPLCLFYNENYVFLLEYHYRLYDTFFLCRFIRINV